MVLVKVSTKCMKQLFHPCTEEYIKKVCYGRCCRAHKGKILVAVAPTEEDRLYKIAFRRAIPIRILGGLIQSENGMCPFRDIGGQCLAHVYGKPLACCALPFTYSTTGKTLITKNRNRLLSCYNCQGAEPAYIAHRWSLEQIVGLANARRIAIYMKEGQEDFWIPVSDHLYNCLWNAIQVQRSFIKEQRGDML